MIKNMNAMHKLLTRPVAKMANGGDPPYLQPSGQSDRDLRTQYPWLPILTDPSSTSVAPVANNAIKFSGVEVPTGSGARGDTFGPTVGDGTLQYPGGAKVPGAGPDVGGMANNTAPFVSNIVNAFRKPPMPEMGTMNPMVTLQKVNMDNERNSIDRDVNAADADASRTLSANTAQAVKQYNLGNRINAKSAVNEKENNANTQISNQQSLINANITAGNNAKKDDFNNQLVERQVAQQREQSANISNFSDKYVGIQNEKQKAKVDMEKTKVLSSMYMRSGVYQAQAREWKAKGVPDPLGRNYDYLDDKRPDVFGTKDSKATGGIMRFKPMKSIK